MNFVYIIFGVVIVLVLIMVLVGLFFVDWMVYWLIFEIYVSWVLGYCVIVFGEVDFRLLLVLYVWFFDVCVGEVEDLFLVVF